MYINKAMIYGNLTRDPELKSLPSGMQVCSFSLATNRVYKDREGKRQEATDYHNIVVFGRQAETSAQYLKKGSSVFVEGRIQTRSWDKDGAKQYRTEVVADRVQFGPRPAGVGGESRHADGASGAEKQNSGAGKVGEEALEYPTEEINPEDIPF